MSLETPIAKTSEKPPEQMLKEPTGRRDYLLAFLSACGMLAPVLYVITWIVAGLLYPGYNQLTQATSELTSKVAPTIVAGVANFGGYALGLLLIAFAFGLYRGVRRSRWLLIGTILVGLFGLICVIQPFFPTDPGAANHAFQNISVLKKASLKLNNRHRCTLLLYNMIRRRSQPSCIASACPLTITRPNVVCAPSSLRAKSVETHVALTALRLVWHSSASLAPGLLKNSIPFSTVWLPFLRHIPSVNGQH